MPEGDTVRYAAARLQRALAGRELTAAELRWGSLGGADLRGYRTREVVAVGKHLLHRLEGARAVTLHSHLRMEGSWRVGSRATTRGLRGHAVRAVLTAGDTVAVGRRLGMLDLVATRDESRLVGHLGPDILDNLDDGASIEVIAARVVADPRPVAQTLLDQRVVAGLGTFWISELLFEERVHPLTPAADLDANKLAERLRRTQKLMAASAEHGYQTSTGIRRPGADRRVHGRHRGECLRCGTPIVIIHAGDEGRERTIFTCPQCQAAPA